MECDDDNSSDLILDRHIMKSPKTMNKRMESLYKDMGPTRLIEAVEKRPAIWNFPAGSTYRGPNTSKKRKLLWMEVIDEVFPELSAEMESVDKDYAAIFLSTKWKTVHDNYLRFRQSSIKDPNCRKSYIYATQLKFLDKLYFPNTEEYPSLEQETQDDGEFSFAWIKDDFEVNEEEELPDRSSDQPMRESGFNFGCRLRELALGANNKNHTRVMRANEPSRDDTDFFRSLLPFTKSLPKNLNMQFKTAILELLLRYCRNPERGMSRSTSMPPYTKPQAPVMQTFHPYQCPPPAQQFYNPMPPGQHFQRPFFNPNQGRHIFGNGPIGQLMQMLNNVPSIPQSQGLCNRPRLTDLPWYR